MQWDYWSLNPEALHQITWLFGNRGIPATYRHMDGFGSHTFSMWNAQGERFWVKWHFKTQQGIDCLTSKDAEELAASQPDIHRQDLYESIRKKEFPKWTVSIQIMPEKDAESYSVNPFDLTKVWHYADYPLIEVGELELNRNPENYFAEVEQAAFSPGNLPPGLGASPDKVLQARLLAYSDAQRYRIGISHTQLDVNKPRCPVNNYHRDGQTRFDGNGGGCPVYQPNSFDGPKDDIEFSEPPLRIDGSAQHYNHRNNNDDYVQAGDLYRLMSEVEKIQLINNIVQAMQDVPESIQLRQIKHFMLADKKYGTDIAQGLSIDPQWVHSFI